MDYWYVQYAHTMGLLIRSQTAECSHLSWRSTRAFAGSSFS